MVMHALRCCPKCAGRKLWQLKPLMLLDQGSNNSIASFPVIVRNGSGGFVERFVDSRLERYEVGTFELWICASCGYAEWYVSGGAALAEQLTRLAANPEHTGVTLHDPDDSPYR